MRHTADYDFFRCRKCTTLLTRLQMAYALGRGHSPCPCGALHFQPSNPPEGLCEGASMRQFVGWWLMALIHPGRHWPVAKFAILRELGKA